MAFDYEPEGRAYKAQVSIRYYEYKDAVGVAMHLENDGFGVLEGLSAMESYQYDVGICSGKYLIEGKRESPLSQYAIVECFYHCSAFKEYYSSRRTDALVKAEDMKKLSELAARFATDLYIENTFAAQKIRIGETQLHVPAAAVEGGDYLNKSTRTFLKKEGGALPTDAKGITRQHDVFLELESMGTDITLAGERKGSTVTYSHKNKLLTLDVKLA